MHSVALSGKTLFLLHVTVRWHPIIKNCWFIILLDFDERVGFPLKSPIQSSSRRTSTCRYWRRNSTWVVIKRSTKLSSIDIYQIPSSKVSANKYSPCWTNKYNQARLSRTALNQTFLIVITGRVITKHVCVLTWPNWVENLFVIT